MAKRGPAINGVAIGLIGAGALLIRAAIRGTSPIGELRAILGGKGPEPLSTAPRGSPVSGSASGSALETATYQGPGGKGGTAHTGGSKPHVAAEMEFISSSWRVDTFGFATSGHVANSDHYRGLAIDAMLPSEKGVATVAEQSIGNAIVQHYMTNAEIKRVKYIIWWRRFWDASSKQWRPYTLNPHTNHVHISFYAIGSSRAR